MILLATCLATVIYMLVGFLIVPTAEALCDRARGRWRSGCASANDGGWLVVKVSLWPIAVLLIMMAAFACGAAPGVNEIYHAVRGRPTMGDTL